MFADGVTLFAQAISLCLSVFDSLITRITGAWPFIFSIITIMFINRFLLHPLGLGSGSDRAKKSKDNKEE